MSSKGLTVKKVTEMFNIAMNFLKTHCNTTIILSSATQPCLEKIEWSIELADKPDMVKLTENELEVFNRAEIINMVTPNGMSEDELEEFCDKLIDENESLLIICNTREEARDLFYRLNRKESKNEYVYHLSTSMCQQHRMDVLKDIQKKLYEVQIKEPKRKKVICVATQLVEAGIDFSFMCVVRILAGLDNLTQAVGRCNRSNEYLCKGKVYFINIRNEKLGILKEIKVAQDSAIEVIANKDLLKDGNLIEEQAIFSFYKGVYTRLKDEIKYPCKETKHSLSRLLANAGRESDRYIMNQPFKSIAKEFKVFDNETVDVIVPYGNGKDIVRRLESLDADGMDMCELQQIIKESKLYTISLYQYQVEKLSYDGWLEELFGGKILILHTKIYSEKCGLESIMEQSVENYIF